MKRTSAIAVAAGLVGSLFSGLIGYSLRLAGAKPASAAIPAAPVQKPVVKTITTTVRIHRKPKVHRSSSPSVSPVHYVTAPAVSSVPVTRTSGSASGGDDSKESGDD